MVGILAGVVGAACGGGTGPNNLLPPSEACAAQAATQLAVGAHAIINPAGSGGCLRLPEAGSASAQYLLVVAATVGTRSTNGIKGPFLLRAGRPAGAGSASIVSLPAPVAPAAGELAGELPWRRSPAATAFDVSLRLRERELLDDPRHPRPPRAPTPGGPVAAPPLGEVRTFRVCNNLQCNSFGSVTATARYVGTSSAIYLDNNAPTADPFTDADLAELGSAFDRFHYPIDTTAFGRESDIDGNGVVIILVTKAVNDLTPDCRDGRIVGYFYGGDLLTGPNSNRAEIFYTLTPAPATPNCGAVGRRAALNNLKPTLIHEFEHMISFNQHSLVRTGFSEDVWLNEALAHFAEELGGRLIPNAECTPAGFASCRAQYTSGNLVNGYEYLKGPGSRYLVFPNSSNGTLAERGAGWLYIRWVLDQFATDSILGTDLSRALVGTSNTGAANLQAATGESFSVLVPQWLMAAYLDDGPDVPAEPTGRLRYKSWGFREIWTNPANSQLFPAGFPIAPTPISASSGVFSKSDTLRAGSGYYFLINQPANGTGIDLHLVSGLSGNPVDPVLQARFGVVRVR